MADDTEGEKKKSGFLKWIILAVLLLALAGGGYFAYLKFFVAPPAAPVAEGSPPAEGTPEPEPAPEPAKTEGHGEAKGDHGEAKGGHGDGKAAPTESLVSIPTFVVNLADSSGRRYLKLSMDLEVKGPGEPVQAVMSKIRDALLMLLSSKTAEELAGIEGKITLRKDIADRINQVLGKPIVLRVYFTDFVIQ
ncbi:flagellar basal body-associated FliL family protein [Desulfolutivibrio sulfoxidireducens]|uniref:flagellar basal body-associated FliL family protein n=1 Tax=Desulfolutivibrio sulfoxidireducens TaxID=2773299 RepID=UPI00159DA5B5|nr:flagellar basal body-associated FliL family protein [Desulfolutivibrio sulfoxidireducens]QLA14706.1 flagellar basal body protein FliL [Desulfolutivibrio sulfoxidireducens]QLA18288.1 flagellar basal body protein FliL [Desulfolutivibrio sulfoxidireducens]